MSVRACVRACVCVCVFVCDIGLLPPSITSYGMLYRPIIGTSSGCDVNIKFYVINTILFCCKTTNKRLMR